MSTLKSSTLVVMVFMSLVLLTGCTRSSDPKIEAAKESLSESKEDVKDAAAEARKDWLKFKGEAEAKIEKNDTIIAEYKAKMTDANGKLKANYDKKIDELEKKNKDLKAKLDKYDDAGKSSWEKFKSEFSHDLEELGDALKNFAVNNKK